MESLIEFRQLDIDLGVGVGLRTEDGWAKVSVWADLENELLGNIYNYKPLKIHFQPNKLVKFF